MPSVSVVIPAYNAESFVQQAISSALRQTVVPEEIIVVDDGSTDRTREAVETFGGRVRYLRQENAGAATARNTGIARATGTFVAFLDADDCWLPDKTEKQLQRFAVEPDLALVYCDKEWVTEAGEVIPYADAPAHLPEGDIFRDLFRANYISSASEVIARREALMEVGLFSTDPRLRNCQDYDLWLRMSARYRIGVVREKLVCYRRHPGNATLHPVRRFVGMQAALNRAAALGPLSKDDPLVKTRLSTLAAGFGGGLFHAGEYRWARRAYWSAARTDPSSLSAGGWLRFALTYLPAALVDRARRARQRDG
ncbi:MAG: glycosyltransferase family A protein [Candidatus Krumholzibacteriia bacterium]